jgi:hypothetical protein
VLVGFQDEMRMGQIGTTTRLWAEKGTRPIALKQQEFTFAYVFGTVISALGKFVSLVTPSVSSKWMIEHLKLVSQHVPKGKHLIILMDRASWHTSPTINIFENITIMTLPTASPELNSAEQIWQHLRQRYLANRCFNSYENICEVVCDAINQFAHNPFEVKSLCTRKWTDLTC